MIARALIVAVCLAPQAALAVELPKGAAEFARLPALGKLVEGGMEKDTRFRTYLVGKKPPVGSQMELRGAMLGRRQYDRHAHAKHRAA
jgi:hypothetical protein